MILMEKVLEEIDFLIGEFDQVDSLFNQRSLDVFSDVTISFISDISKKILSDPLVRLYPDVATFAFYCRRANLDIIKNNYILDAELRIGRGILFHIAPGNVPVNFAYSLLAGLLTGNINIVRVPSKDFEQVNIICNAIRKSLIAEEYKSIFSNRIFLVKYNRESIATGFFSKICDVRVIWGGDQTIEDVRKFCIPPHSTELTFSDRYSIAIINAESYLRRQDKSKIALDFYNDTLLFDQNACTSPQTIYWLGSLTEVELAKSKFWNLYGGILKDKEFKLQPIISVDKLTTFYSQAILHGDIEKEPYESNEIWRVKNKSIHNDIDRFRCTSGYFNEIVISSLNDLSNVINRKYQSVGYLGFSKEELKEWVMKDKPLGIDRIIQIGRTMDFSLKWDGHNLIFALSRCIDIE